MKKLIVIISCLFISYIASTARESIKPVIIKDVNRHEINSKDICVEISKTAGNLSIIFYNVPSKEREKSLLPDSSDEFEQECHDITFGYYLTESNKMFDFDRITYYPIAYDPFESNDYSPIICDVVYMIADFPDGEWNVLGHIWSNTEDSGEISPYFEGKCLSIKDGCKYILRPEKDVLSRWNFCFDSYFYRHEWVVCNDNGESETSEFFKMRFKDEPIKEKINGGEEEIYMYPLLMSRSTTFDETDATAIAYMGVSHDKSIYVKAADADIPTSFWGSGMAEATTNPLQWRNFKDGNEPVKVYEFGASGKDDFQYYNFVNDRYVYGFKRDGGIEETVFGDMSKINVSATADPETEPQTANWHGEWLNGIGAVGDWYASNLPYPVYDLPEGVTPSRLLYVRDIKTNEILWGDASKDPGYMGVEKIVEDASGEGETHYYNLQGIEEKNPENGIFIRVRNGEVEKVLLHP